MKSGWQYVQANGTTEKMAPKTLVDNVKMNEDENGVSLKDAMPSNPNLLINGDFQVWQRGTSFTGLTVPQYKCDRWLGSGNLSTNVVKHDYGMLVEAAASGYYMGISQRMEMATMEAYQLIGKTLTLSYKLRANQAFITYQNHVVPAYTDYIETECFTFTQSNYDFVVANGYSNIFVDRVGIKALEGGSVLPVGFWTIFEWVKLEPGSFATPFVPRSYAEELAMCQRYFYRMMPVTAYGIYFLARTVSAMAMDALAYTPSQMRVTPTASFSGNITTPTGAITDIHTAGMAGNAVQLYIGSSGMPAGSIYPVYNAGNTTAYIDFDAELYS